MLLSVLGKTKKGNSHANNEDCMLIDRKRALFAVADGVTLPYGGKEASERAIKYLKLLFNGDLKSTVEKVNKKILFDKNLDSKIGCTTLTAVNIMENSLRIAHIGDSSVQIYRKKGIKQITMNDSVSGTSILTQVIGQENIQVHYYEKALLNNDLIMLATDGITNLISSQEFIYLAISQINISKIVSNIFSLIDNRSVVYKDDRTLILISVSE